jgi:hypothetical protein
VAAVEGDPWLVISHVWGKLLDLRRIDVRRIGRYQVKTLRGIDCVIQVTGPERHAIRPESKRIVTSHCECIVAAIGSEERRRRAFARQGNRDATTASAQIERTHGKRPGPSAKERDIDESLGIRSRNKNALVDAKVPPKKFAYAQYVGDRLVGASPLHE